MLKVVVVLVVVVGAGVFALASLFLIGMRTKWPPVVDTVRHLNRTVFNPKQMETAGAPGAFAGILRHVGRKSGQAYEVPLGIVPTDDGFVIALVYGPRTEWLRNVLAAGMATVVSEGLTYEVDRPEVVAISEADAYLSVSDQRIHALMGVDSCLRLHRVDASED